MTEVDYCGCCGRELFWTPGRWCHHCHPHIAPAWRSGYVPAWDRTYFAQHGEDCPFQV